MMKSEIVVFIITNRIPEKQFTTRTLRKQGYTGKIYYIISDDTEKEIIRQYEEQYKNCILYYNKKEVAKTFDNGDNFRDYRVVVIGRNSTMELAKKLGIEYYIEMDDDYTRFNYKVDSNGYHTNKQISNLDNIFKIFLDYYKSIPALSIAFAQGGDYITNTSQIKLKRKCMNTFFRSTKRPFYFIGRINEDVNAYTVLGAKGELFLTITNISIDQKTTQKNERGLTDIYLDAGTYVKSFYTVMMSPSSVKVGQMGTVYKRYHHDIEWKNQVPVILDPVYKKE